MLRMKIPKMPKMPKIPSKILAAMGSYRNSVSGLLVLLGVAVDKSIDVFVGLEVGFHKVRQRVHVLVVLLVHEIQGVPHVIKRGGALRGVVGPSSPARGPPRHGPPRVAPAGCRLPAAPSCPRALSLLRATDPAPAPHAVGGGFVGVWGDNCIFATKIAV